MHTKKIKLYITLSILFLVFLIGTFGFMVLEGKNFLDSFYYVIVTLSTVGYGDLHPVTSGGKVLSIFLIVAGVGTFMSIFANLADLFISRHEEERRIEKLSTFISLFFTEIGTDLMKILVDTDVNVANVKELLTSSDNFSHQNMKKLKKELEKNNIKLAPDDQHFCEIKKLLVDKTDFLISILENSNALDYDLLTKLLWTLMHVRDEFLNRRNSDNLSPDDIIHLTDDLKQVYGFLRILWIDNMVHIRSKYPNFFGLSMYMNPYNK